MIWNPRLPKWILKNSKLFHYNELRNNDAHESTTKWLHYSCESIILPTKISLVDLLQGHCLIIMCLILWRYHRSWSSALGSVIYPSFGLVFESQESTSPKNNKVKLQHCFWGPVFFYLFSLPIDYWTKVHVLFITSIQWEKSNALW